MELLSQEGSVEIDPKNKVPLRDILAQHRKRYILKTNIGDIVLRRTRYLDSEAITIELINSVEGYEAAIKRISFLSEKSKYPEGLDAGEAADMSRLGLFVKQHLNRYYVACFVDPAITTTEELDAIIAALDMQCRDLLLSALSVLTNPDAGDVMLTGLLIAGCNDLPISEGLTLETMTDQQAATLTKRAEYMKDLLK